ncbi:MAG: TonB-dependent receptor [Gammaproteobacteria bacterium]|nr:TonB-dependent receptor [Gammaproteobacteria bacterium]
MTRILRPRSVSLVAAAVAMAIGAQAGAETVLGEITVTARKRAESLLDVPFAVSARSEEALRNAGATNIEDVSRNVAGFTVQNLGPGQSQVALRGISAGKTDRDLPGVKEQVGVYLDESVLSLSLFTPDLELYDLNRVEVLRGPQGTLFGSGSLSGTVRYISNQPDTSGTYGDVELTASMIDTGGNGGNLRGMVNVGLTDTAALRLVGYYSELPGFIDAVQPGGTIRSDVNSGTRYGFRAALRLAPTDHLVITPRVVYQDVDVDGYNRTDVWNMLANPYTTTEPAITLGDRQQYTQLTEKFQDEFMLADLTIEATFGAHTLTSISSYTDRDILVLRDATQLTGSVTYSPLGGSGAQVRLSSPLYDRTKVEMFTQELRLASDYDGRFQWLAGAFYSDINRHYGQQLPTPGYDTLVDLLLCDGAPPNCLPSTDLGAPVNDMPFYSDIPYDFKQMALFAEINVDLSERFSATLGGRYYDFEEDRNLVFGGLFSDPSIGPGSAKSDGFLPRVLLSFDVSDNVQLNAQASRGFRLGGINDPLNLTLCTDEDEETFGGRDSFEDEKLWNYELGAKIGFAGGRAQINVAAYHAEIDNLQVPVVAGSCSSRIVFNVPSSHATGLEVELTAQPTDNFDFGLSATWVSSKLDSTITSTDSNGVTTVVAAIEDGNRMPSVPKIQVAANATYQWPVSDAFNAYVTASWQHVGDRYTQVADQAPGFGTFTVFGYGSPSISSFTFDPLLPSYDIANLRVGVRNDVWEAAVFVNNLTDESARLGLDQERGRRARVGYLTNQPRTIGISYRRSFGR